MPEFGLLGFTSRIAVQMSSKPIRLRGGIDAGGTSFKCGVFDRELKLLSETRVPVTSPDETLNAVTAYFRRAEAELEAELISLGIASFGPVDVDRGSPLYGTLLDTPKPGWSGVALRARLEASLNCSSVLDTDVNGALLAEMKLGAARGCRSAAYVTVGTGIGAAIWANGALTGAPMHPEFGHIAVRPHPDDAEFVSVCSFHDDCLEGFASARAFEARFGSAEALDPAHHGWLMEADYLAQACRTLYLSFRVDRIVLGGGLMLAPHLLNKVRSAFIRQMNGYAVAGVTAEDLIRTPGLGDRAGMMGAALLCDLG